MTHCFIALPSVGPAALTILTQTPLSYSSPIACTLLIVSSWCDLTCMSRPFSSYKFVLISTGFITCGSDIWQEHVRAACSSLPRCCLLAAGLHDGCYRSAMRWKICAKTKTWVNYATRHTGSADLSFWSKAAACNLRSGNNRLLSPGGLPAQCWGPVRTPGCGCPFGNAFLTYY